ncbi:MAG: CDP-alcohol phosphatidyltransferase [Bacteroidales bacterium]
MKKELIGEYEASLKSMETENIIDRIFYRPVGFYIARWLLPARITPNTVTVVSIVIGASAGYFFHFNDAIHNVCGILLLLFANILDCVDGQLARLSGIKSPIGRILDGLAGDLWFTSVYVGLALRLSLLYGTYIFFPIAVLSGFSHLLQANITDYYKTLHLYFISREKGAEFQTFEQVRARHKATRPGLYKVFYLLYGLYSLLQIKATPAVQRMLDILQAKYGDNIPQEVRLAFRKKSLTVMRYIDLLTFNGRTVVLFVAVFTEYVWVYFIYEIVFLNAVLVIATRKHERICASFCNFAM